MRTSGTAPAWRPWATVISTFHSMCARLLRREAPRLGFMSSFTIHDEDDRRRLIKRCLDELDLDPKRYNPRSFSAQVSNLKNELVDHEAYAARAANHLEQTVAEAYALYQRRLRQANAFDFDDLIMTTVNLLQAFPDVAEHYRRRFRHVLVDRCGAQHASAPEADKTRAGRHLGVVAFEAGRPQFVVGASVVSCHVMPSVGGW